MGGDDTALFRASDNLESLYAKSALRQFYIALWRGHIEGWSLDRFEEATGLKLTWEGSLKEDLPPMPKFLNRLLALPIAEQNALFAALEARIEANIEHAIEAGTFERGVETIAADSLSTGARETVFVHEASGAETELVEVLRRDRLEPLAGTTRHVCEVLKQGWQLSACAERAGAGQPGELIPSWRNSAARTVSRNNSRPGLQGSCPSLANSWCAHPVAPIRCAAVNRYPTAPSASDRRGL